MWSLILGIILCVILVASAVGLIIIGIVEKDGCAFLYLIPTIIIIIASVSAMREPAPNSDPIANYNEYCNLMLVIEDVADNPDSATGKIVQEQVNDWNEKYDGYMSLVGNAWNGRKYPAEAFEDCSRIDYWKEVHKFQND